MLKMYICEYFVFCSKLVKYDIVVIGLLMNLLHPAHQLLEYYQTNVSEDKCSRNSFMTKNIF